MNAKQPNFEKLKTAFYNAFIDSDKANTIIMLQALRGDFRSHYTKVKEFKDDFNKWLNNVDIRQSGALIDILVENQKDVPKWMAKKQYVIEYNNYDFLDLINV